MEQETVANPESVAEEVTQAPEAEQATEAETDETSEGEQPEGQAPDEDFEDMEWEGKSFKAPKGLRDGVLRQSDYTKKTMAHAEERKAWETSVRAHQAFIDDVGDLRHIERQLEQYAKVDWNAYHANNPQQAQAAYFQYQQLRDNRANLANDLDRRVREREANAAQEFETRVSQDLASLSKPDPSVGWDGKFTPEVKSKLENLAKKLGYSDDRLARADALDVKALNLMALGQEYLKQQRALARPKPPEAQPVPKIDKGRGNVIQGLSDRLSPEEWNRRREAQIRARG